MIGLIRHLDFWASVPREGDGTGRGGNSRYKAGGSVVAPKKATIAGQPHMLAYINPDERRMLKAMGGADIPGPAGIPSFPPAGAGGGGTKDGKTGGGGGNKGGGSSGGSKGGGGGGADSGQAGNKGGGSSGGNKGGGSSGGNKGGGGGGADSGQAGNKGGSSGGNKGGGTSGGNKGGGGGADSGQAGNKGGTSGGNKGGATPGGGGGTGGPGNVGGNKGGATVDRDRQGPSNVGGTRGGTATVDRDRQGPSNTGAAAAAAAAESARERAAVERAAAERAARDRIAAAEKAERDRIAAERAASIAAAATDPMLSFEEDFGLGSLSSAPTASTTTAGITPTFGINTRPTIGTVVDTPIGPQTVTPATADSVTYAAPTTAELTAQLGQQRAQAADEAEAAVAQIAADKARSEAIDAFANMGGYSEFGNTISDTTGVSAPASLTETGLAAGTGLGIKTFGNLVDVLGNIVNPDTGTVDVGFGTGQVDPGLAAAVTGTSRPNVGAVVAENPNATPNALNAMAESIQGFGSNIRDAALESYAQNFPEANLARTGDIVTTDIFGNTSINPLALGTQVLDALPGTLMALAPAAVLGIPGAALGGAAMTVGEVSGDAADTAYRDAIMRGLSTEQAQAIADQAAMNAAPAAAGTGALSGLFGGIGGLPGRIGTQMLEEGITEGIAEPSIASAAATTAAGQNLSTGNLTGDLNTGIVGALLGGGIAAVPGQTTGQVTAAPPGTADTFATPYGGMDTSGIRPGFSSPGFTPGATSPGVTVEGTFTDVTPGYTPSGPTVGQTATSPTGIASAYQQAADTMAEAGVRGVGDVASGTGQTATSMDAMAAVDIINNEIAETGGLSPQTAQNLAAETGLSQQDIEKLALFGFIPDASGTGPTSMVEMQQSLEGRMSSVTNRLEITENALQRKARELQVVEEKLQENPGSQFYTEEKAAILRDISWWEAAKTRDLAEQAGIQNELSVLTGQGYTSAVEAAPTDSGPSQAMVDFVNSLSGVPAQDTAVGTDTEAVADVAETAVDTDTGAVVEVENTVAENVAENVSTDTGVTVEVQDNVNNQVSDQVTTDTGIVVETTPNTNVSTDVRATDDVIEGTAVEIVGQIPGTTTSNTPTTTTATATTNTNVGGTVIYEPDDEDVAAVVEVDDTRPTGPTTPAQPTTTTTTQTTPDRGTETTTKPPFECPDGYTAVKLAGRWVCQKTSSAQVGRPTLATQPYLSQSGFAGTDPNPGQTRTVTTTQTVEGS